MAFEIPVDVDYFDHPKTKKLCLSLKKPEGDIYPLRLWKWCAKYAKDGILPSDVALIEAELGWKGAPGRLHGCLMGSGFIESDGVTVHDWMWHIGRAISIYESKKRKMREKYDREKGILPEEIRKTSGSNTPTQDTRDTRDTQDTQDGLDKAGGASAPRPPVEHPQERPVHIDAAYLLAKNLGGTSGEALARYVGFLENREDPKIPAEKILESTRKLFNTRQGFEIQMGDKVPFDRIFAYGIDEAIKNGSVHTSYVGKVCQAEYMRIRDGCGRA